MRKISFYANELAYNLSLNHLRRLLRVPRKTLCPHGGRLLQHGTAIFVFRTRALAPCVFVGCFEECYKFEQDRSE